ncbi:MAG: carboxypeptidase regulatory-like domain-containing protein [Ignavibacteriales bacterium]|nr:carboxypeptidase regulatory-like domain-containing protein [Ignavibacteriales bacterium]
MRKVKQLISFSLFTVVLFSSQLMYSQTTASINGTVVDQIGNALPGANVIAIHQPTGTQFGTSTRLDGKYNLVGLRVGGPYKVTVSFVGYTTQVEEGFSLALSQNLKIDFKLPEQAVQLTGVTVTAEKGAVLSQARTGAAQNVSLKQIEEIPTLNRTFASFAKLSPLFSGTSLQAAGRSSRFNNIQIDGTAYNDIFGLSSSGTPGGSAGANPISFDAIREFQVVIAPYDVRLSGFTGAGINAITRSGTNQFNGSLFFYGRNQAFTGQRNPTTGQDVAVTDFSSSQYGFRLGGPIMKDKLFFFVNGEMTADNRPVVTPSLQAGFGANTPAQLQAKVDQFAADLRAKGMEPGSSADFTRKAPSTKFMIKFDYNLADNHQLTLRHNYVDAYQDNLSGRGTQSMSFDSYNYRFNSTTNSTALLLNSHFGNNMSNELILGYTTIREKRTATGGITPLVVVKELNTTFTMTAGLDNYSAANALDQDVIEFTDNFSYYTGNHTITLGTHNEFFKFTNLYIRNVAGNYSYNSLADFEADLPASYTRTYARFGDQNGRPAASFNVAQLGFYIQDEWAVLPQLKITYGLRVDIPTFPTGPAQNDSVSKYFPGINTSTAPTGNMLWSPRVGFNWDVSGDRTTQLRGGLGIFSGRVPYVWISNNYGNSGMLTQQIDLKTARTNLVFRPDPTNQYTAGSSPLLGAPSVRSEIDLADPNLKMPQLLKLNAAVDQQLPLDFVGTVEFLYSKTINDMLYRKLNLNPIIGYTRLPNGGLENGTIGRPIFGGENLKNNNFTDVLQTYNTSDGYQYNLSFQIQRSVARGLSLSAAYNYMQAFDRNSVTSSQAQSQMAYLAVAGDPNSPPLTTSDWEITHRAFISASFTWEFLKNAPTTISLFYNGQSGRKFAFCASGSSITTGTSTTDLNGDNYPGNDLFYIPRNANEILLGSITNNQFVPATAAGTTFADLDAFIKNDDYLSQNRGKIAERNGATAPWQYYLDMHIQQAIPDLWGMGAFLVYLDIQNVLNLINPSWGQVQDVASGNDTYNIVSYRGRVTYNGNANVPVYSFSKPVNGTAYSFSDLSSRWQMQLGARYAF